MGSPLVVYDGGGAGRENVAVLGKNEKNFHPMYRILKNYTYFCRDNPKCN